MRKTIILSSLMWLTCMNGQAQQIGKGYSLPHVTLSNGTTVEVSFDGNTRLDILVTDNPNEITVYAVNQNGQIIDVDYSFAQNDNLSVEISRTLGEVDIFVVTEEEIEHVATVEATKKEEGK